jgi:hypothetical protein
LINIAITEIGDRPPTVVDDDGAGSRRSGNGAGSVSPSFMGRATG